ncbi:hypothetical protein PIB30_013943 [Stylosanthes scabra]|uniref:F-box domain-containing protein n=1 Tax=Stylosanthes scabra TaxID=79078 RepID=A0ABU6W8F8_9FABA|nr:hypothetical protein [Stylosanthes scabra]
MEEQVFPDEILLEIFIRTEPKTATTYRALGKTWNQLLQEETFLKENTFKNEGRHSKLLLQIGKHMLFSSPDLLCTLDPNVGRITSRSLPIQFGCNGWWNFIGSQFGVLCIRYSLQGFIPAIKVWNPVLNRVRDIEDPTEHLHRQAVSGYAFGYTTRTDKYHVVHVSKRHIKDKFVHCNVFNSSLGEWKHGYISDGGLQNLSQSSIFHEGMALWINWGGQNANHASDIVVFDVELFEIKKIRIIRGQYQHFQNLILYEGNIYLVGYELNLHGIITCMSKVDIPRMSIQLWKRILENIRWDTPSNPTYVNGKDLLHVYEIVSQARNNSRIKTTEIQILMRLSSRCCGLRKCVMKKSERIKQQIFLDDILLEIFNRTEPKTATRCRSLSKGWCKILTAYTFRKDNTLANTDKHNNLLIQVGLAPWISGPDSLSMVDVQDGVLIHVSCHSRSLLVGGGALSAQNMAWCVCTIARVV